MKTDMKNEGPLRAAYEILDTVVATNEASELFPSLSLRTP